jgi:fermentation-respiration switch protein FrsA (DUF1100 family)
MTGMRRTSPSPSPQHGTETGYWSVTHDPPPDPSVRKTPFTVTRAGEDVPAILLVPHGPVGYFGLSMGTRFGVPLIAAEPRISVAVLGLFGHPAADTESAFARAARQVTIPVLFLQQWDDELFPRDDCLALFDLLASEDKTLHANPGGHLDVPRAELGGAAHFLRRRLGGENSGGDPGRPVALPGVCYYGPPGPFAPRPAMG